MPADGSKVLHVVLRAVLVLVDAEDEAVEVILGRGDGLYAVH